MLLCCNKRKSPPKWGAEAFISVRILAQRSRRRLLQTADALQRWPRRGFECA